MSNDTGPKPLSEIDILSLIASSEAAEPFGATARIRDDETRKKIAAQLVAEKVSRAEDVDRRVFELFSSHPANFLNDAELAKRLWEGKKMLLPPRYKTDDEITPIERLRMGNGAPRPRIVPAVRPDLLGKTPAQKLEIANREIAEREAAKKKAQGNK